MDRSDQSLEEAIEPQTERTQVTARPGILALAGPGFVLPNSRDSGRSVLDLHVRGLHVPAPRVPEPNEIDAPSVVPSGMSSTLVLDPESVLDPSHGLSACPQETTGDAATAEFGTRAEPPAVSPGPAVPDALPSIAAVIPMLADDAQAVATAQSAGRSSPAPIFDTRPAELLSPASVLAEPAPRLAVPTAMPGHPEVEERHPSSAQPRWLAFGLKAGKVVAVVFAGWMALSLLAIFAYRFIDPPTSMLMLQRRLAGETVHQTWVPISAVAPGMVRTVLVSEDGRFCQHWGVDVYAIENAISRSGEGTPRGASTISMQVAKNLFLWPSKSYLRKVLEVPLTFAIEALWSKSRILEVYLNIAEWGPGVFGVEAAARHHFAKPAFRLTDREAAQLAVSLPNPIQRDAGDPGPGTRRLATVIQARARSAPPGVSACIRR